MKHFSFVCLFACYFYSCHHRATYTVKHHESIPISSEKNYDFSLKAAILPYKDKMEGIMLRKIGYSNQILTKKSTESTLGNWTCDAIQFFAKDSLEIHSDFSIVNYGGIRINQIDSGNILLKNIYELMPFDNSLVLLEIDSTGILQLISHMSKFRGWPQSKELRYTIYNDSIPTNITINQIPLNNQTNYRILLSDYIYSGGDQVNFLSAYKAILVPVTLRDALIYAVIKQTERFQSIHSTLDQRISLK